MACSIRFKKIFRIRRKNGIFNPIRHGFMRGFNTTVKLRDLLFEKRTSQALTAMKLQTDMKMYPFNQLSKFEVIMSSLFGDMTP